MVANVRRVVGGYVVDWGPTGFENTAVTTTLPGLLVIVEAVFGEEDVRGAKDDDEAKR